MVRVMSVRLGSDVGLYWVAPLAAFTSGSAAIAAGATGDGAVKVGAGGGAGVRLGAGVTLGADNVATAVGGAVWLEAAGSTIVTLRPATQSLRSESFASSMNTPLGKRCM